MADKVVAVRVEQVALEGPVPQVGPVVPADPVVGRRISVRLAENS